MTNFNKQLQKISEKYTVVLLVDELDRCLPEYAIKILERLHHLTENVANTITLISIDKKQLESTVEKFFGANESSADQYLKKFIQFEVTLDKGIVSEKFMEKYADYINLFDSSIFSFHDSIEEFMQEVFKCIDARTQEHLVQKANLAHRTLFSDAKDYSFMCIELLIVILKYCYKDVRKFSKWLDPLNNVYEGEKPVPPFDTFMTEKFKEIPYRPPMHTGLSSQQIYAFTSTDSLYGAIAYIWYELRLKANNSKAKVSIEDQTLHEMLDKNINELKSFVDMIDFIK